MGSVRPGRKSARLKKPHMDVGDKLREKIQTAKITIFAV